MFHHGGAGGARAEQRHASSMSRHATKTVSNFCSSNGYSEAHGIAASSQIGGTRTRDGGLWHAGRVDLVYNRITDFYGTRACDARACEPMPPLSAASHGHALYANNNLALLTDAALLHRWGVDERPFRALAGSAPVSGFLGSRDNCARPANNSSSNRRGFSSRGCIATIKLHAKCLDILQNDYVAQALYRRATVLKEKPCPC
jgi:hypothetical protein